ncbi:TetR/AcrR family transcriptional regulator [Trujillonella humicola]|uniref:TetR/AcrR family transcriptional regulator n=1 Tax=Trujillonella humicola TaxID=3383699 RepID=UPI0039062C17
MEGLRERKRAHARAATVEAALGLFAEHGYERVTVADICAAAAIAPRTFFRYFPSKVDVLAAPVQDLADRLVETIEAAPAEWGDTEVLRRGLREVGGRIVAQDGPMALLFRLIRSSDELRTSPWMSLEDHEQRLATILAARRGQPAGPDWRTRLEVACLLAAFRVWLHDFAEERSPDPLEHLDEVLAHR